MQMEFLPFPRGRSAKGTPDGGVVGSPSFFNEKGKPMIAALAGESEHAQAMIAGTFLDKALTRCLKAQFKAAGQSNDQRRTLIGSFGSILGPFGAKIIACRAFGLIEKGPSDALAAVKSIRNKFAHSDFTIGFASADVAGEIDVLEKWLQTVEYGTYYDDGVGGRIPLWVVGLGHAKSLQNPIGERDLFLGASIMLYLGIINIQWAIDPDGYEGAVVV